MNDYQNFIDAKAQASGRYGFSPLFLPDQLFDFQKSLVEWSTVKGRSAILADCGLGKSAMQLTWAENVVRKTNGNVLVLTPLSVSHQTVKEGAKFGIEVNRTNDGKIKPGINVTNYERLHYFDRNDFTAVVCDESSCLKNFDGVTKEAVTEFMRKMAYRLLCTATPAPNDFIELGTSSEAIGELGFMDMLGRFFKKNEKASTRSDEFRDGMWRFRGHGERDFWRWVCSWARAVRKPSDLGFDNADFILPPLLMNEHVVSARTKNPDWLFDMPAMTLDEQRGERRRTVTERCELVADLISRKEGCSIAWCHLNDEGDLLEKLIPGSVQVAGKHDDEYKEEALAWFLGETTTEKKRVLISKPKVFGLGLNLQCCSHQVFFPSHSFEQWYQAIRRCWRFGQKNPVTVDMVCSEGERGVLSNLKRKAAAAERMFENLVHLMNDELSVKRFQYQQSETKLPLWMTTK